MYQSILFLNYLTESKGKQQTFRCARVNFLRDDRSTWCAIYSKGELTKPNSGTKNSPVHCLAHKRTSIRDPRIVGSSLPQIWEFTSKHRRSKCNYLLEVRGTSHWTLLLDSGIQIPIGFVASVGLVCANILPACSICRISNYGSIERLKGLLNREQKPGFDPAAIEFKVCINNGWWTALAASARRNNSTCWRDNFYANNQHWSPARASYHSDLPVNISNVRRHWVSLRVYGT